MYTTGKRNKDISPCTPSLWKCLLIVLTSGRLLRGMICADLHPSRPHVIKTSTCPLWIGTEYQY